MLIPIKIRTLPRTPSNQYTPKHTYFFETTTPTFLPNFDLYIATTLTTHLTHPSKKKMEHGEENEQDTAFITLGKIYKFQKDYQVSKTSSELNYWPSIIPYK
jgi:hypothetical protein